MTWWSAEMAVPGDTMPGVAFGHEAAAHPRETLVVIGNGMVGHRLCRELVARGATERYAVAVFGEEPSPAYDRVHLTDYLARTDTESLLLSAREWYEDHGIDLHLNDRIVEIDRSARRIRSASGAESGYDRLVLATGSSPFVPAIEGAHLSSVFTYRTVDDLQAIRERSRTARQAVVIGGGLLGLEAARALQRLGLEVSVIEVAAALMPSQLDQRGSNLLAREMAALGIRVLTGTRTIRIQAAGRTRVLHFVGGGTLTADMVVMAAGIRPRTELAVQSGLRVSPNRGVVVDDHLRTSDPRIHAIGECASHRSGMYGLVAPGYAMADVLATTLCGGSASFSGSVPATRLKVLEVEVSAAGNVLDGGPSAVFEAGGTYRRLRIARGRIVAALGVGEWPEFSRIQQLVSERGSIRPWQLSRFERTGSLWGAAAASGVTDWPAQAIVCNCLTITRGDLAAACAQGCVTVDALVQRTGASTLCGSCRPLVAALAGAGAVVRAAPAMRGLLILSAAALVAALAVVLTPPIAFANSVIGAPQFESLWRIGFYRQLSGFALLGLCLAAAALTFRRRWRRVSLGSFATWRTVHAVLGLLTLAAVTVHTGLRLGDNANFALATVFLVLTGLGTLAGGVTALEQRINGRSGRRLRSALVFAHIIAIWPLPVLVAFHVLTVYYF